MKLIDKILFYFVRKNFGSLKITNGIKDFETEKEIINILKKNQFVDNGYFWSKDFVKIILKTDGVYIQHDIGNPNQISVKVENPILTLNDWVKHYSKL